MDDAAQPISFRDNALTSLATDLMFLQTGSLQVSLYPYGAVSSGRNGRWMADHSKTSGATVSGLLPGSHTLASNNVLGWIAPSSQAVSVTNNLTTTVAGSYKSTSVLPTATRARSVTGGGFQFSLTGPAGSNCVIQISSNLQNWSPLPPTLSQRAAPSPSVIPAPSATPSVSTAPSCPKPPLQYALHFRNPIVDELPGSARDDGSRRRFMP